MTRSAYFKGFCVIGRRFHWNKAIFRNLQEKEVLKKGVYRGNTFRSAPLLLVSDRSSGSFTPGQALELQCFLHVFFVPHKQRLPGQGTDHAASRARVSPVSCGKEEPGVHQGRVTEVSAGQAPAQALPPSSALPSSPCSPLPWSSLLLLPQNLFSCLCRVSFPCIACSASSFHPEIWGKHPPSPKPVSQNWGINCILQSVWPPAKHLQNITATEPGFQNHWNVLNLDGYEGTLVYPDSFIFSL